MLFINIQNAFAQSTINIVSNIYDRLWENYIMYHWPAGKSFKKKIQINIKVKLNNWFDTNDNLIVKNIKWYTANYHINSN